jgi:hypothetical protein
MNHSTPPPIASDDEYLDRQFSAYFQAQLPATWPECPRAEVSADVRPLAYRDSSHTARLTLAASVAAFIGFGLWMAPETQPTPKTPTAGPKEPSLLEKSTADGSGMLPSTTTPTQK